MLLNLIKFITISLFSAFALLSCSSGDGDGVTSLEKPYCGEIKSFQSFITVTGEATFQTKVIDRRSVQSTSDKIPIRNAEIRILNGDKKVVQCAETSSTGNFSFLLPKENASYVIQITSRAQNDKLNVSILKTPEKKEFHYISKNFTVSKEDLSIGTINAPADGALTGGAFNILDQIHIANDFLRENTKNCSTYGCEPFTVAPKVTVYWEKGVNPGKYFDAGPVSFYVKSQESLYLLGGLNGDIENSDTDHFDNSIILHEYGHFIEHKFANTDSPGGKHSGNSIIDPRLAWGEGWANFFQAAIRKEANYIDSAGIGNDDVYYLANENLETPNRDIPQVEGEGNFREFSITRALWDLLDSNSSTSNDKPISTDSETTELDFALLWSVFTGKKNGFRSPSVYFRNVGYFYELLYQANKSNSNTNSDNEAIGDILASEKQLPNRRDYSSVISTSQSNCDVTSILGTSDPAILNGEQSDQFNNNDFYSYTHPGGSLDLSLEYTQVNDLCNDRSSACASNLLVDLDLYLYNKDYIYFSLQYMIGVSDKYRDPKSGTSIEQETWRGEQTVESINLANLAAGVYMINVRVFKTPGLASSDSGAQYKLKFNGDTLCKND